MTAATAVQITVSRRPERVTLEPKNVVVQTLSGSVSVEAVCDLIAAAGPLTIRDIAGGLDVAERKASMSVHKMVERNCLKQDEFDRYRLCGACSDH